MPKGQQFFDHERLTSDLALGATHERGHLTLEVQRRAEGLAVTRDVYDGTYDETAQLRAVFDLDALLDDLRHRLALRYLTDPKIAIGEVAYLLGYSEPSAFHRAFKRWTGVTPAEARAGG